MKTIAVTGSIGSGKSLICNILKAMGFPVYDCDSEAKRLMNESTILIDRLKELFGTEAIIDNRLNKVHIAQKLFSDDFLRQEWNKTIHNEVRKDITKWKNHNKNSAKPLFIETAILKTAAIDQLVDRILWIEAPRDIRLDRAIRFRKIDADDFDRRDLVQRSECFCEDYDVIINDGLSPVLPQVERFLNKVVHG